MAVISVLPGGLDIIVKRGDTLIGQATFTDPATGDPIDMSEWVTWLSQIRATLDEPDAVLATITVDTSDLASGVVGISLDADSCAALTTTDGKATYYWDAQATKADGTVRTWFGGKFKVSGDVSVPS